MRISHRVPAIVFASVIVTAGFVAPATRSLPSNNGRVIYVDDDAPVNGNGKNWNRAFRHLHDALAAARAANGNVREIRVAKGLYKPDHGNGVTPGDILARFEIVAGVPLRGGYAGHYSGPGNPNRRDFALFESVVSGDLLGNDGPLGSFTNYQDNSIVLVIATGLQDSLVEGFTFTAKQGDPDYDPDGGAIACEGGSMAIESCRFQYNRGWYHGGGAFYRNAKGSVRNCTFFRNRSSYGGGMTLYSSTVSIADCHFERNTAFGDYGGGLFAEGPTTVSFERSRFIDNFSENKGGAVGIRDVNTYSTYTDCEFISNSAGTAGGAVVCRFGNGARFERCLFRENETSHESGAVHLGGDSFSFPAILIDCDFIDNFSSVQGGAAIAGGTFFERCRFIRNVCGGVTTGAAVQVVEDASFDQCLFNGNDSWGPGGAMMVFSGATATLSNCTLTSNITLETGGAINGKAILRNCVLWNNSPDELSGAFDVTYSNVPGGFLGVGNIDAKPQFHSLLGADGVAGNEDDDLRLLPGSACADAGDNASVSLDIFDLDGDGNTVEWVPFDLLGNHRMANDPAAPDSGNHAGLRWIVDMGAIESQ